MEKLIIWHDHLPLLVRVAVDFFVSGVLIRGILARRIGVAVEQLIDTIGKYIKLKLIKTERDVAIWLHYQNKARGNGHKHPLVDCNDGKCDKI